MTKKKTKRIYKMEHLKIYLFRHGQTYYNKNKIFTGYKDSSLTPLGKNQAKIIAKNLIKKRIDVAFQTKLSRSKDTLKIILKFHPECKKIITDNRMIERGYGVLEGKSHEKIIEKYGREKFDRWHRGWEEHPEKGESFKMIEKRVKKFIKYLLSFMKNNKVNVAISAHGNSIRLFRKIMEKASIKESCCWTIPYDKYFEYTIKLKNPEGI
jgi:broad specificity phosphatase PhoE